jgi:hypothetical protein
VKDHQEIGHTRPMSGLHKNIPTKTYSNPMNKKSSKNIPKIEKKKKRTGLKDLAQY